MEIQGTIISAEVFCEDVKLMLEWMELQSAKSSANGFTPPTYPPHFSYLHMLSLLLNNSGRLSQNKSAQ